MTSHQPGAEPVNCRRGVATTILHAQMMSQGWVKLGQLWGMTVAEPIMVFDGQHEPGMAESAVEIWRIKCAPEEAVHRH